MPDLAPFENPAFYDELQVLTREATHRPLNLMVTTGFVVPNTLAAAGLLFLVGGPLRPFVLPTRRRPGARLCARHYIPNSEHSGLAPLGRGHGLLAALPSDLVARLDALHDGLEDGREPTPDEVAEMARLERAPADAAARHLRRIIRRGRAGAAWPPGPPGTPTVSTDGASDAPST